MMARLGALVLICVVMLQGSLLGNGNVTPDHMLMITDEISPGLDGNDLKASEFTEIDILNMNGTDTNTTPTRGSQLSVMDTNSFVAAKMIATPDNVSNALTTNSIETTKLQNWNCSISGVKCVDSENDKLNINNTIKASPSPTFFTVSAFEHFIYACITLCWIFGLAFMGYSLCRKCAMYDDYEDYLQQQ